MSFSGYGEDASIIEKPASQEPVISSVISSDSVADAVATNSDTTVSELKIDSVIEQPHFIEQPQLGLEGGAEGDSMTGMPQAKTGFFLSTMFDKCTRAPWQPPKFVFPIVWTFLYTLYIIILNKTWKSESSRGSLIIGLILNLAWIPLFYWNSKAGLAVIAVMIGVAFDTSRRLELDGYHTLNNWFYTYIAWLIFAFTLNLYIALKCKN